MLNRKGKNWLKKGGNLKFKVIELEIVVKKEEEGVEVKIVLNVNIEVLLINVIEGKIEEVGVEVLRIKGKIVGEGVL